MKNIRNFSIIAHIDHGKSTLSDRLMQECGAVETRNLSEQMLDSMYTEKKRGITIKAKAVRLKFVHKDGQTYYLNFIDTPGHVDFSYEVSRSLAACEGSILVIDSSQGVEAQTLANVYKAVDANHEMLIVLNKIDLPAADPERVKAQIEDVIGMETKDAIEVSAKTGQGILEVLENLVERLPSPQGDPEASLQALLVDSWYDQFLGVVVLIRVVNGTIRKNTRIKMMSNNIVYPVEKIGIFTPKKEDTESLQAGEIGFLTASIKQITDCKVGDTITEDSRPCEKMLPGFKKAQNVVFCSIFPIDSSEFENLKDSITKLHLNDPSFSFETESSAALGFGFRCGFLGLLHLEITQERINKEFDLEIITTAPSVVYKIHMNNGEVLELHNPADMPDPTKIDFMEEPWVKATIMIPQEFVGIIISLCTSKRGEQINLEYSSGKAILLYKIPLSEIVFDFYDRIKSASRGYASFDWDMEGYKPSHLVKLSIMINGEAADALSCIIHKDRAYNRGREMCERLKDLIPRQQYKIAIQAGIGGKIIARETINAYRKDVTAKLYGGDVTRRMKLLEKQKKGKKKMQAIGQINIPSNVFIDALKMNDKT